MFDNIPYFGWIGDFVKQFFTHTFKKFGTKLVLKTHLGSKMLVGWTLFVFGAFLVIPFWYFWWVIQLPTTSSPRDIYFLTYHWGIDPFLLFGGTSGCRKCITGHIISMIVIILRVHTTFYDQWNSRYSFFDIPLLFWGTSGCRNCIHILKRSCREDCSCCNLESLGLLQ